MRHRFICKLKRISNIHNGSQNHDQTEKHAKEQIVINGMVTASFGSQDLAPYEFL
jgi:hypothetical protein